MAINSVVQGSAADLIKLAMIDLHRRIKEANPNMIRGTGVPPVRDENGKDPRPSDTPTGGTPVPRAVELRDVRMLLQIHDELVFEAPAESADAARELIVDRMQRAMDLDVPLVVDSGISGNWYEAK
jgi:DNA polymerase-1